MKKEELLNLRLELEDLKDKRNKVIIINEEINKLKETPEVKRYLELIELFKENTTGRMSGFDKFSDDDLLNIAISKSKITPSEEIYVYMGTYKYTNEIDIIHAANDIPVSRLNNSADYVLYYNLEARYDKRIEIPYIHANEFESTHKIIIPKNVVSREKYFYELQHEYFETIVLKSEEEAKKLINKLIDK